MSTLANTAREAAAALAPAANADPVAPAPAPAAPAAAAPAAPTPAAAAPVQAIDAAAIRAEARAEERTRIQAIVGHAEADGRTSLAHKLAFTTDMAPEAAAAFLSGEPKAEAAPARSLTGATVPTPAIKPQAGATDKADAKDRLAAAVKAVSSQKA